MILYFFEWNELYNIQQRKLYTIKIKLNLWLTGQLDFCN